MILLLLHVIAGHKSGVRLVFPTERLLLSKGKFRIVQNLYKHNSADIINARK